MSADGPERKGTYSSYFQSRYLERPKYQEIEDKIMEKIVLGDFKEVAIKNNEVVAVSNTLESLTHELKEKKLLHDVAVNIFKASFLVDPKSNCLWFPKE